MFGTAQWLLMVIFEENWWAAFSFMVDHPNRWLWGREGDHFGDIHCHITNGNELWIEWGDVAVEGYEPFTVTVIQL